MQKYKVVMCSWGGTEKDYMTGLTYEEAWGVCKDYNWYMDTGYVWDLEIVEDD